MKAKKRVLTGGCGSRAAAEENEGSDDDQVPHQRRAAGRGDAAAGRGDAAAGRGDAAAGQGAVRPAGYYPRDAAVYSEHGASLREVARCFSADRAMGERT